MARLLLFALFAAAAASNFTLPQSDLTPPTLGTSGMLNQAVPWVIAGLIAAFFSQFNFHGMLPMHPDAIRIDRLVRGF